MSNSLQPHGLYTVHEIFQVRTLEEGKATHSSILAWRIPWTVYSPWGCKESDTTEQLSLSLSFFSTLYEGFPGGSVIKNLPDKQEKRVRSLGHEDPLEEEMTTHSSILTVLRCQQL